MKKKNYYAHLSLYQSPRYLNSFEKNIVFHFYIGSDIKIQPFKNWTLNKKKLNHLVLAPSYLTISERYHKSAAILQTGIFEELKKNA